MSQNKTNMKNNYMKQGGRGKKVAFSTDIQPTTSSLSDINSEAREDCGKGRASSPLWKGIYPSVDFIENNAEELKKKGLRNEDMVLEIYKGICRLKQSVEQSEKTSNEISKTVTKIEEKLDDLESKVENVQDSADENSLKLYYEKTKYQLTVSIQNYQDKDFAMELLDHITEGSVSFSESWPYGLNKQHLAI